MPRGRPTGRARGRPPGRRRGDRLQRRRARGGRRALGARPGAGRARGGRRRRLLEGRQRRACWTALAAAEPRLKVIRRAANSGGCGTPRNDGHRRRDLAVRDVPGQRRRAAARRGRRAAGRGRRARRRGRGRPVRAPANCRRGARCPGSRGSTRRRAVVAAPRAATAPGPRHALRQQALPHGLPARHGIRFPEGRFPYEDFVFTARVLAAAPRIALIPDPVYVWHVRRSADRAVDLPGPVGHRQLAGPDGGAPPGRRDPAGRRAEGTGAGRPRQVPRPRSADVRRANWRSRDAAYRRAWWELTRAYLARVRRRRLGAHPAAPAASSGGSSWPPPSPAICPGCRSSRPARPACRRRTPAPRTARPSGRTTVPQVSLEPLLARPVRLLPLAVDAELRPGARGTRLRLRLHELYGRVAQAGPETVDVEWRHRDDGDVVVRGASLPLAPCAGRPGAERNRRVSRCRWFSRSRWLQPVPVVQPVPVLQPVPVASAGPVVHRGPGGSAGWPSWSGDSAGRGGSAGRGNAAGPAGPP